MSPSKKAEETEMIHSDSLWTQQLASDHRSPLVVFHQNHWVRPAADSPPVLSAHRGGRREEGGRREGEELEFEP